jgi:HEAT repeat protein
MIYHLMPRNRPPKNCRIDVARVDLKGQAVSAIEKRLDKEKDDRVLLEAAGAGSALNSTKARERLEGFVWNQERADLRMETVFILTELRSAGAADILKKIATDTRFHDDEIRQAAVWGLGKAGLKRYADLINFVGDGDPDVSLHAIVGFGPDTSKEVIDQLIGLLLSGDAKRAPAASEALRLIGSNLVLQALITASRGGNTLNSWVVATLGRLEPASVRAALQGNLLLRQIEPLFLLSSSENWLAVDSVDVDLKFLIKQNL